MTDNTLPPLPVGGPYLETGKFRPLGDYDGQRFFECEEETIYAYATTAVNEARAPLLAEIGRHPHRHCGGVAWPIHPERRHAAPTPGVGVGDTDSERDAVSASIEVATFDDWYRMAGEFFKACRAGATLAEIDNGHKALTLGYFGVQQPSLTPVQEVKAMSIFTLAGREVVNAEFRERAVHLTGARNEKA